MKCSNLLAYTLIFTPLSFLTSSTFAASWTGDDLSSGGKLTQNTTLTLSGGETVSISKAITSDTGSTASLTISGSGTLNLSRETDAASVYNTYTGPTYISDGTSTAFATLKISNQFTLTNSSSLTIGQYGVLDLAAGNALGYASAGMLNTISMNGNATVTSANAGANHINLSNFNVSGTGNQIIGTNAGSTSFGNYFFAGSFTLQENAALEIKTEIMRVRGDDSSLSVTTGSGTSKKTVYQSGIFNIGKNATLTINPKTEGAMARPTLDDNAEKVTKFIKQGAGTMTINGSLNLGTSNTTSSGTKNHQATVQAGTLNVTKIWGSGQFNQTGGTTVAETLEGEGTYVISGGELQVTDTAFTFDAPGSITITGGKLTATKLYLGGSSNSISGGVISASTKLCVCENSEISITGGSHTIAELYVHPTSTLNVSGTVSAAQPSDRGTINVINGGTLNVTGDNGETFKGKISVSGSKTVTDPSDATKTTTTKSTLNLNAFKALYTGTIELDGGVLSLNVANGMYYVANDAGLTAVVQMKNGAEITNTAKSSHSNLGTIEVSGTGNKITASSNAGTSTYGQYLLAGKISLAENADLTMNLTKVTLRREDAGVKESGKSVSGFFDVGKGATLNANIETVWFENTNTTPHLVKQGAGTMTISGIVTGTGTVSVEGGTLNLNGKQTYVSANDGATTVYAGGLLGTGTAENRFGTLDLTNTKVTLDGGKIAYDVSSSAQDAFTFSDLTLINGAGIELNWIGEEEQPDVLTLNSFKATNIWDAAGKALTSIPLSGDFTGMALLSGGTWTAYSSNAIPEPATWVLLLLGLTGLGMRKKRC